MPIRLIDRLDECCTKQWRAVYKATRKLASPHTSSYRYWRLTYPERSVWPQLYYNTIRITA